MTPTVLMWQIYAKRIYFMTALTAQRLWYIRLEGYMSEKFNISQERESTSWSVETREHLAEYDALGPLYEHAVCAVRV